MRVMFTLSMPGVASWNGKWSGEGRRYFVVRHLRRSEIERLGLDKGPKSWPHRWDDGWMASVNGRVMGSGERKGKSDGFCGYEWMVDRILRWGDTYCRHEFALDSEHPGWERCANCQMGRQVTPTPSRCESCEREILDPRDWNDETRTCVNCGRCRSCGAACRPDEMDADMEYCFEGECSPEARAALRAEV